jgi:transposase
LYVALELSATKWKLAMSAAGGDRVREREVEAGDLDGLMRELDRGRERLGLPADAPVVTCYEAGRDGFWIHRELDKRGIRNVVVDSSSIEVNRRQRRAKTDRLDARKLLGMLLRYGRGEKDVWSVVRVPSVEQEDGRRLHRERERLQKERTAHRNRIGGLLALHGVRLRFGARFEDEMWERQKMPDGSTLPPKLLAELRREGERLRLVEQQLSHLNKEQRQRMAEEAENAKAAQLEKPEPSQGHESIRTLTLLKGIGMQGAWVLWHELFSWRSFANRRELAGAAGLTPTPYASGGSERGQGISKSGNPRVRSLLVELAWCWLRWQPDSKLSRWYHDKFGRAGSRPRRVGIVALARQLLVALWRYLYQGELPAGALLKA